MEISVIWGLGVAMAIYLTAGVPARILIPLLPLHCGCLPVSTAQSYSFYRFTSCRRFLCCGLVYGLYYNLFFDFEQTHHIVAAALKVLIWLALSLLTLILIQFCAGFRS